MLATHPPSDELTTGWALLSDWSFEAEAAARVGDTALAREAAVRLAPYADRMALGGGRPAPGPGGGLPRPRRGRLR